VFATRKGGPLSARRVAQVVAAAAQHAGLTAAVSAHWLRHAHASHALDRGARIASLQDTTRGRRADRPAGARVR
jgi:integrase/recombinase XerD